MLRGAGSPVRFQPASFNYDGVRERGVAATQDLPAGAELATMPAKLAMTAEGSEGRKLFGKLPPGSPLADVRVDGDHMGGLLRLAALLAVEQRMGSVSPWHTYLSHVPSVQEFRRFHPLFASEALLRRFEVLPAAVKIRQERATLVEGWNVWQAFAKKRPAAANNAEDAAMSKAVAEVNGMDFSWALAVIRTRSFKFGSGAGSYVALEPLLDDINAGTPKTENVEWGGSAENIEVRAKRAVSAGEELLVEYAHADNAELVAHWGLYLPGNPRLVPPLPIEACESLVTKLTGKKPALVAQQGVTKPQRPCKAPKGEAQPALFCAMLNLSRESCRSYQGFP